jgi:hypothetical protein
MFWVAPPALAAASSTVSKVGIGFYLSNSFSFYSRIIYCLSSIKSLIALSEVAGLERL